ncbi:MAG: DNA cytosine methyltransferase [Paludibacteraceae bacterium]|nr:DNA cytosine methyltransferase [Paludibacteraceae bacterium]
MTKRNYTFIDLFAGCGGLSEGFVQAGFLPIAHVEMNNEACETLRTRSCYHYCCSHNKEKFYFDYLKGSISRDDLFKNVPSRITKSVINAEISDSSVDEIFRQIHTLAGKKSIDLIIGGPPCQAYSLLGRHNKKMEDDPRTLLYLQYGKFLKEFNPAGFVFENVPGLLSAKKGEHFKNLQIYFKSLGYEVHYKMLTASDYGVLQERHRLIIVGWKSDCDLGYPNFKTQTTKAVVNDILSDLPKLKAGESREIAEYESPINQYLVESGIRSEKESFVTQNITRPVNANDAQIYEFAIKLWNKNRSRLKYTDLPVELRSQKNESSFLDRFKVVNGEGKSHTLVAHMSKDGHYYIHPDIKYCRSISVREAARLQSFPDNFYFEGSRSSIFKQIGNAVPPLMAKSIAESINEMICLQKDVK